ncbi:MAG: hypothetical protein P9E88_18050 [Candidatus Competibacter sp.]|nr:hypothetical protein [Candidatus Competibacter sp.]
MNVKPLEKPSDALSPLAKAAALEALETLQSPDNAELVLTTAHMLPQQVMAVLLRAAGRLQVGEASHDELRGALLMAVVWISEHGNPATAH